MWRSQADAGGTQDDKHMTKERPAEILLRPETWKVGQYQTCTGSAVGRNRAKGRSRRSQAGTHNMEAKQKLPENTGIEVQCYGQAKLGPTQTPDLRLLQGPQALLHGLLHPAHRGWSGPPASRPPPSSTSHLRRKPGPTHLLTPWPRQSSVTFGSL